MEEEKIRGAGVVLLGVEERAGVEAVVELFDGEEDKVEDDEDDEDERDSEVEEDEDKEEEEEEEDKEES